MTTGKSSSGGGKGDGRKAGAPRGEGGSGAKSRKGGARKRPPGSKPKPKRNAKHRAAVVDKQFGTAVRKSAELGGRKPTVWETPRGTSRTATPAPDFDIFSDHPNGFDVSISRAVEATASEMFRAFNDPARRGWCHVPDYVVRSTVAPRLLRLSLTDGSLVTVTIARKGNVRCAVELQQSLIATAEAADEARRQWRDSLARLAGLLAE